MSLDSLRKLRRQTVETLMMELTQIAQSLSRSEERYLRIETELQADAERYRQQTRQGLTIEVLLEWQVRMDSRHAAMRQICSEIEQASVSWKRTNDLLVEANQEYKLLDLVLERREATKRADIAREEQRTTDEAAGRRYLLQ